MFFSFSWSAVDSTTIQISQILTLWTAPSLTHFSAVLEFPAMRPQLWIRWGLRTVSIHIWSPVDSAHSLTFIFLYLCFFCLTQTVPGCFPALKKLVDDNAVIIIAVALGIAALEVLYFISVNHSKSEEI